MSVSRHRTGRRYVKFGFAGNDPLLGSLACWTPSCGNRQESQTLHTCTRARMALPPCSRPTFADVYCGAGLFSEGLRREGLRPVFAVDVDPMAVRSYRRNVSRVAQVADARSVPVGVKADVLIAGPPCQGFSTLGRQDPKDERNLLCLAIPRWAAACESLVVVVENVPSFIGSSVANLLVRKLERQGYAVRSQVLEATHFGVAQHRQRGFLIASKAGLVGTPAATARRPRTAGREILDRPFRPGDPMHVWPTPSVLALERFKSTPRTGDKRNLIAVRADLCPPSWLRMGCQATDVWGRVDPDRPANTLRCTFQNASKGRYVHPFEHRVLSLREGARLQGVPDRWVLCGKPYPVARQIGNGVPVPMAQAIARVVLEALNGGSATPPSGVRTRSSV